VTQKSAADARGAVRERAQMTVLRLRSAGGI
jgi:hypothetical protein